MPDLVTQPSFAAGEIGPELYGRVDQSFYYIGLRTCRNFMVRQYGGVVNRPGTKLISQHKDQSKKVRLVEFSFNSQQNYILQIGEDYTRFIRNGGEILESSTEINITSITAANPAVVTTDGSHGYSDGDDVFLEDIEGMVELNGRTLRVANKTATTFELQDLTDTNVDGSGFESHVASTGKVTKVYEITTPWQEEDLFSTDANQKAINYAQDNDVLTVCHNDYYPRDITRTADDAWTINTFPNTGGPFLPTNIGSTTVYAGAATGNTTLTASASLFTSDMVGELFYIEQEPDDDTDRWEAAKSVNSGDVRRAGAHYYKAVNSGTTGTYRPDWTEGNSTDGDGAVEWEYLHSGSGVVEITAHNSATSVDVTVVKRLPDRVVGSGNTTDNWAKSAWSTAQGYPATCAYHKERLAFAGTTEQPNFVWLSGVDLRSDFNKSFPILDDEAITVPLKTRGANAVRHLLPFSELIALTSESEHLIDGVDGVLLASGDVYNDVQGYTGSSYVPPVLVNDTALFVQDMGGVMRTLEYTFDADKYKGIDLTARSPHLFIGRQIVDMAYQRHPFSVIWVVLDNGALIGLTFMQEQQVIAWHRHDSDNAKYESVACIREGTETATYFAVRRTIDGKTRRYVERMSSRVFNEVRDAFFVDCGLTYDGRNTGATTMTITGGTTWDSPESLTITASADTFLETDVDTAQLVFWVGNIAYRLNITAFTSKTEVTAVPVKELPAAYRATAFTDWEMARTVFRPLDHIEGKDVNILADGNVVQGKSVSGGSVTLDNPAAVVHIGIPYVADLETLDLAQPEGQSKGKTFNVPRVFLTLQDSRAVFVSTEGLASDDTLTDSRGNNIYELKQREPQDGYDAAIPAETKVFEILTSSTWSKKGRIAIRQTYPLPITVNGITMEVQIGAD